MPLRTKTKLLAHQFARLHAYFRNELDPLPDADPNIKALRNRSPAEIHSTAVHEAGHAVLRIAFDLDVESVSIIPDLHKGTAGRVLFEKAVFVPKLRMLWRDAFYLRDAVAFYAGAEAIRQLIPTDPNPDAGASDDKLKAAKLIIRQIGGHPESMDFVFSLAQRRCALLVAHYRPEILALASELEAKLVLPGTIARQVFMRSLKRRSRRLMTFGTDRVLGGLIGDEPFPSFLRRINLPDRLH